MNRRTLVSSFCFDPSFFRAAAAQAAFACLCASAAPAAAQAPPLGTPYYPPGRIPAVPRDEAEVILLPVVESPNAANLFTYRELFVTPPPRTLVAPPAGVDEKTQAAFRAGVLWADARNAFHEGEYARANQFMSHLRMVQPDHEEAMLLSAQASFALGNDRTAVDELRRAAARPTVDWLAAARNYKTLYGKPVAYADQIYALTRRVKKAAKPNESTLLLAFQYEALGYRDEAAKLLETARAAFPEDPIVERMSTELRPSAAPAPAEPAAPRTGGPAFPEPPAEGPRLVVPPPPSPQSEELPVPAADGVRPAVREF